MPIKTSETEIRHLLIAWLAISFAFTVLIKRWMNLGSGLNWLEIFIISAVTVGSAFIFHELSHKFVAQRYGSWSEFRMQPFMLLLAIIFPFLGPFIFAAPGAVMIFNPYLTREENGKIAIAGPMTNVALAFLFLPLSLYASGMLKQIGDFGVMINALLAVFNMIPFSVLDGRKVLAWDKRVYGLALCFAIVVLVMSVIT